MSYVIVGGYITEHQAPAELLMAESGTYHGVDWTIIPEHVRRPGFRLYVAGRYLATLDTRDAAHELVREWVDELAGQELVG